MSAEQLTATHGQTDQANLFDVLVAARLNDMQPAAQRVVRYICNNRLRVLSTSAAELASQVGASDATVVRAARSLGFTGMADLRQALAASLSADSNPADNMRRTTVEVGEGVEQAVASVIETHLESLRMLENAEEQALLVRAIRVLNPVGRILVFGIGPSASLAEYSTTLLHRHGRAARAITAGGFGLADQLLDLRPGDGMLILAYSRTYPEVVLMFEEARRLHLPVVLVTDSLDTKLAKQADIVIRARRGRHGRVAMHGTTVVVLEALILGLAFANRTEAMTSLARIGELRKRLIS